MSESQESFRFPTVQPADGILVAGLPGQPCLMPAIVINVNDRSVSALGILDNGYRPWICLRHKDDPWVVTHPDFCEDGANGVFEVGPTIRRLELLEREVVELRSMVRVPGRSKGPKDPKDPKDPKKPETDEAPE